MISEIFAAGFAVGDGFEQVVHVNHGLDSYWMLFVLMVAVLVNGKVAGELVGNAAGSGFGAETLVSACGGSASTIPFEAVTEFVGGTTILSEFVGSGLAVPIERHFRRLSFWNNTAAKPAMITSPRNQNHLRLEGLPDATAPAATVGNGSLSGGEVWPRSKPSKNVL